MSQQQRDNSGAIFKNNTAGKGDNFPGYGGSCMIEGREYFISAWVKESTRGKFFSLAFKPKEQPTQERQAPAARPDFEDEIPF
jgi:hypothetical protein